MRGELRTIGIVVAAMVLVIGILLMAIQNEPRKSTYGMYPNDVCHCPCDSPDRIGNAP